MNQLHLSYRACTASTSPSTPQAVTNTPPTITILGDNPFTIDVNNPFIDPGATATDTKDGNITSSIIASSTVSTTTVGLYVVTYTVTDSDNLTATATREVDIIATVTDPVVTDASVSTGGGNSNNTGNESNINSGGGGDTSSVAPVNTSIVVDTTTTNSSVTCPLLYSYLRYGYNNDPVEVLKLQAFLKNVEGANIDLSGTFDEKTLVAVNAFQTKYLNAVMVHGAQMNLLATSI